MGIPNTATAARDISLAEIDLVKQLQIRASELGHRLWRNNSGVGWAGGQVRVSEPTMVFMRPGDVLVRQARALHAGLAPGSSDLIGLTAQGRFIAVECKSERGRATEGQENFLETVHRLGGLGILARVVADLVVP